MIIFGIVWFWFSLLLWFHNSNIIQPVFGGSNTIQQWNHHSDVNNDNHHYESCIPCHIIRIDTSDIITEEDMDPTMIQHLQPQRQQPSPIQCITQHPHHNYRLSYDIHLPESFIQQYQHVIDDGDAYICVINAYIDESNQRIVIMVNDNNATNMDDNTYTISSYRATQQQQQQRPYRSLQDEKQQSTNYRELRLLVVRIIDVNGMEPTESIDSLEGAIFGTGSNPDNITTSSSVVSHLNAVTHGKVVMIPSYNITTTGIIEVPITLPVNGTGFFRILLPELLNATEIVVGSMADAADVYLFCLPDGANLVGRTGWTGFTINFEPYSFFQKSYCTKISSVIHELGHSIFGFAHSSKNGEEYGDISCYMGFIDDRVAFPLKAFNAHKHWLSGWFDDRTETVNRTVLSRDDNERRLVSFVDYTDASLLDTDVVLITIDDLYIQYDVPKGYNMHSLSRGNVLVTQANGTMSRSVAVANLSMGQSFTYQTLSKMDDTDGIVIEVCDIGSTNDTIDYSIISIFLNDGEQQSACEKPAENGTVSSISPTLTLESAAPSTFYSFVPSDVPTNLPSVPTRNAEPSVRPIPSPENFTADLPMSSRITLAPNDAGFATSGLDDASNASASDRSNGVLQFTKAMDFSTNFLITHVFLLCFLTTLVEYITGTID